MQQKIGEGQLLGSSSESNSPLPIEMFPSSECPSGRSSERTARLSYLFFFFNVGLDLPPFFKPRVARFMVRPKAIFSAYTSTHMHDSPLLSLWCRRSPPRPP